MKNYKPCIEQRYWSNTTRNGKSTSYARSKETNKKTLREKTTFEWLKKKNSPRPRQSSQK